MSEQKFNEQLVFKMMHEFAMQTLNEAQRILFESCNDETKNEMFKENLAAGQGFYQGAKWQFDSQSQLIKEKDAEIARLREALVAISKGCPTKAKGCLCLENTALIALEIPTQQELEALAKGDGNG